MKRGFPSILATSLVLAFAACGDDATVGAESEGSESETADSNTDTESDSDETDSDSGDGDGDDPATATDTTPGDGDGDDPTVGDGDGDDPTVGDGDGDDPTNGDGDGDPNPGDGDGDPNPGDGDGDEPTTGEPDADDDMDGVANMEDNCPADPNPNQLDFDGDGDGNVCDPLVYTMGGGTLTTTATASAGQGSCDVPLDLNITGGEVIIQLDDDANVADVEFVEFELEDTPEQDCQLAILPPFIVVDATLSISDFLISNAGGPFPTSVAHNQNDHDNGIVDGDQDMEHPIQVTGTLSAVVGNDPPADSMLDFPGQTPPAAVLVENDGDNLELTFSDADFVVLSETIMSMDLPVDIDLVLTGLEGTVNMTP